MSVQGNYEVEIRDRVDHQHVYDFIDGYLQSSAEYFERTSERVFSPAITSANCAVRQGKDLLQFWLVRPALQRQPARGILDYEPGGMTLDRVAYDSNRSLT